MPNFSDVREHLTLINRQCQNCGKRLRRKPKEILNAWRRRKYCDQSCAARVGPCTDERAAFYEKIDSRPGLGPTGECHLWAAGQTTRGYGTFRKQLAHRVAYRFHHGEDAGDLFVCHRCDTPLCVNPAHLFLGTNDDNMKDMAAKGRGNSAKGTAHHSSKLTPEKVRAIRSDVRSSNVLSAEYGVSRTVINRIRKRLIWKDVA